MPREERMIAKLEGDDNDYRGRESEIEFILTKGLWNPV